MSKPPQLNHDSHSGLLSPVFGERSAGISTINPRTKTLLPTQRPQNRYSRTFQSEKVAILNKVLFDRMNRIDRIFKFILSGSSCSFCQIFIGRVRTWQSLEWRPNFHEEQPPFHQSLIDFYELRWIFYQIARIFYALVWIFCQIEWIFCQIALYFYEMWFDFYEVASDFCELV